MSVSIQNIKQKVHDHKTLIQNFSYLSAFQVFNMLLPLITYPYLIRILGAELYGLVIYAQIIATYFGIIIDFGFRISATKEISIYREDKNKISEIVSSVLQIKAVLWIISIALMVGIVLLIPMFQDKRLLLLLSFGICFNEFLFPQWYFQGVERMKYITFINLLARTIFLILIFLVVKQKEDYLFVPIFNGFGALIGGVLGLYIVFVKDKVQFKFQTVSTLLSYCKESLPLLGSNLIISVKDRFSVIFIGATMGMQDVAIYDLATKIMSLFMQPIDIINSTIYPRVAKEKNMMLMAKTAKLTFILILISVLLVQPLLDPIIEFLGKGLKGAIWPTRVLLIAPLMMVWSLALGRNCLIVHGKFKIFTMGMLFTTLFYLILISMAYSFDLVQYVMTFIVITILTYGFELVYRWSMSRKCNLI